MGKSKVCVVSHDAGAAEVLASYVARNKLDVLLVLEGPAIKVFERRMGKIEIFSLEEALISCKWCLCGTSWASDLEWRAIRQARDIGKYVVVFLDHWVNYRERFIRQGISHFPNEIWVGDAYAHNIASQIFADIPIKLVENPYFLDVQEQLARLPHKELAKTTEVTVLYVCEPIADHALKEYGNERYFGYTEHDALRYFCENIAVLNEPVKKVIIRPHPSEPLEKYNYAKEQFGHVTIDLGGRQTLLEEINQSQVVVGCHTMAMIIGLLAKKRVISCIPPQGGRCTLPQREIEIFADLVRIHKLSR